MIGQINRMAHGAFRATDDGFTFTDSSSLFLSIDMQIDSVSPKEIFYFHGIAKLIADHISNDVCAIRS